MTSPLSPEHFDDLHDYIHVQVAGGYLAVSDIVDDAVEVFADVALDPAGLRDVARRLTDLAITAHQTEQLAWTGVTDCDRLDAAFAELNSGGIVARQHFSCCLTCGSHEIREEMRQSEKVGLPARGFTFFHVQDTEHAVAGDGLYLSYGVMATDDTDAAVSVGQDVVATLEAHGLAPAWNGRISFRIGLPMQWRRRRG